ncbi:carbohydrate ABC transporter permease [Longirhabdus pacifica]|uniref:carbohydrate ABC transporter permease n=1 Tax=Longirhabdus pacifica TaxID=2305227 RepID=UPI00100877DA|nr:sugar ABC transporter permease [Longirhabdus pacifica]
MKGMSFRQFGFILPLLVLISVFSLWPVLQSFTYTFFDYKLNDQQKAGLYFSDRFNLELFSESELYVTLLLEEDQASVTNEADLNKINQFITNVSNLANQLGTGQEEKVIKINDEEKEAVLRLYEEGLAVLDALQTYQTPNTENLTFIIEDIQNSIIPPNFIGLQGYKQALSDTRLFQSMGITLIFTSISVFFELILGIILALILNQSLKGRGIIRTTSLIPWAIPTAVAALLWMYLYNGNSGIVANLFATVGLIESPQDLLSTGTGAIFATILADVWKTTPYMALLLLAGLQTIPKSLYEASDIDGANKLQAFFNITLPLLKPSILVALLFRTLDAFRVFDLVYVLTGGGPGGATETVSVYAYKVMFSQTNFGYGSIIVMFMFFCVAIIATIFVKLLGTNVMDKN